MNRTFRENAGALGQPLTLNIEPARNYIGVLPQVNAPLGTSTATASRHRLAT
jgi:hypothetical protein